MRETVRGWRQRALHASIFGSFARGEAGTGSDIDVFLVRKGRESGAWDSQVVSLQDVVRSWTGNEVNVLEWSRSELREQRGAPILADILQTHIRLDGMPISQLLEAPR